jgi:hypothetical protein
MTKATSKYSEYTIIIACPRQSSSRERASMWRFMCTPVLCIKYFGLDFSTLSLWGTKSNRSTNETVSSGYPDFSKYTRIIIVSFE